MARNQFSLLKEKIHSSFPITKIPRLLILPVLIPIVFVTYVGIFPASINEPTLTIQSTIIFYFQFAIFLTIIALFVPCIEFEYYFYFEDSMKKRLSLQPLDIEAPLFLMMLEKMYKEKLDSIANEVKYFTNKLGIKDTESRIYGFEFIKKILYVVIILFFILFALVIYKPELLEVPILKAGYISLAIYAGFWVYWIIRTTFSKKFAFYFARAFSEIILVKTDEIDKIAFLDKCLNSYNKYLGKNINLQINDSSKIFSQIICQPKRQDHTKLSSAMNILPQVFKSRNKLSPAKYLASLMNFQNIDEFLIRSPRAQKAKELIALFTGVVSTIIAMVQVFLPILLK